MSSTQETKLSKPKPQVVETSSKGILTAFVAFCIWGCFPLYFKRLSEYNAIEIVGHRIIWTFICVFTFLLLTKRWGWIKTIRDDPKLLLITFTSGALIATNWLIYVWAINDNRILEASLGYFISPLIGILMSMVFLGEHLRRLQWVAIALAATSVGIQVIILGSLPWVSLVLAVSFSIYGIIQRRTPLQAIDVMFIETTMLVPFCLLWFATADVASSHIEFWWSRDVWFLMLAGPITLVPLLTFNQSTKMVAFSVLSFMNYLTPTFIFLLAVFYYDEPFSSQRLMVFSLIWLALAIFSIDLWRNRPSKVLKKIQHEHNKK